MAYSSILGADPAPQPPSGRDADLLGPSDNSDSGSDARGTREAHADSDSRGTGESGMAAGADLKEGADILPDKVVHLAEGEGLPGVDPDSVEFTDLDADVEAALREADPDSEAEAEG